MIFLFNWVILRFHDVNFQGLLYTPGTYPHHPQPTVYHSEFLNHYEVEGGLGVVLRGLGDLVLLDWRKGRIPSLLDGPEVDGLDGKSWGVFFEYCRRESGVNDTNDIRWFKLEWLTTDNYIDYLITLPKTSKSPWKLSWETIVGEACFQVRIVI